MRAPADTPLLVLSGVCGSVAHARIRTEGKEVTVHLVIRLFLRMENG